ncbi:hypothetical protein [Pseudogracilibacillus sp. SO10305]|uniref:hypothetical protein n=1 Tax=Pseudogracilibacillus sp. SO10305 TaxID=3098292 RepID=UPI00300E486A
MKRFLYMFCWMLVIGFLFYYAIQWRMSLVILMKEEFLFLPLMIFTVVFPIILGMLLRLPKLILEWKQYNKWSYDWMKFFVVALPNLFVLILFVLSYFNLFTVMHVFIVGDYILPTVVGLVFGYVLLDCIKGSNSDEKM